METYKNNKNRLKPTNHSEERDLFTLYINVKNRNHQNGSKSTSHSEECDLPTPLNSFYSFSKTSATLIDGSQKCNCCGDLNFRFCMLLKGAVNSTEWEIGLPFEN